MAEDALELLAGLSAPMTPPSPGSGADGTLVMSTAALTAAALGVAPRVHVLVLVEGGSVGRRLTVTTAPSVIGRAPDCTVPIPDSQVSSHHPSIRSVGHRDDLLVTDLRSTNGTFIDCERLQGDGWLPRGGQLFRHDHLSAAEAAQLDEQRRDLDKARHYVSSLLPGPLTEGPVRTDWVYEPCALLGGDAFGCQRLDDQVLLAILNDVSFDFSYEPSQTATLWVQVDHRLMVTARHSPLRSVDRLRLTVRNGAPVRSTVDLLELLLQAQADVMVEIVRHVTRQVDRIEDDLLAGRLQVKRAALGSLRRLLVRLQRLLAPEPASLFRLLQHPPQWMSDAAGQKLHAASEEFSVVLQEMAVLQERTKLLQEELGALLNERTGRSLFVLTVVTVLALPINIMAGLFGMNVGGVPLAGHPAGFWIVTGVVLAFTAGAALWLLRRGRHL